MSQKFDLDAMLANGEITQKDYDARMRMREYKKNQRSNGGNGSISTGSGSKTKRIVLTEDVLVGWYTELTMLQAQVADGKLAGEELTEALGTLATVVLGNVNPLKVRLPEIEATLSDAEIALAEAQLAFAKADAGAVKARRTSGPESKEAKEAGDKAKAASDALDKATKARNEAKAEYFKASR